MAAPPFPLSSSVGYWIMGLDGRAGMSIVDKNRVRPGDIAVYGRRGNPLDGNGPNGHCGVVLSIDYAAGRVVCMESRGSVGICFQPRAIDWWSGFVRVPNVSDEHVRLMREFVTKYDARTGTVLRVGYYAKASDVNRDGVQDRAAVGDGNGVDCSGLVFLVFAYAWFHAGAPADSPPPLTREQWAVIIAILKELDVEHGIAADFDIDDYGRKLVLDRWGGLHLTEQGGKVDVKWESRFPYEAGKDKARRVRLTRRSVPLAGYVLDQDGNLWPFTEKGGVLPPGVASVGLPPDKIAEWQPGP